MHCLFSFGVWYGGTGKISVFSVLRKWHSHHTQSVARDRQRTDGQTEGL